MPIRFRCGHCNQLLGIARRKSGTLVRCPSCAAEVLVPATDQEPAEAPAPAPVPAPVPSPAVQPEPAPAPAPQQPMFERSDFEQVFRPDAARSAPHPLVPLAPPPPAPVGQISSWQPGEDSEEVNVERVPIPPEVLEAVQQRPGIWLSPALATLLSVLAVVALALAFAAGLAVGIFFRPQA